MAEGVTEFKHLQKIGGLEAIDLAICRFLKNTNLSVSDEVLIAATLVSYKFREGNVCLNLNDESLLELNNSLGGVGLPSKEAMVKALQESAVVGEPGDFKPLIIENGKRLYFQKLWKYETNLADDILKRSRNDETKFDTNLKKQLDQLFPSTDNESVDWQKVAAVSALLNKFTVISGGPGTGKTTTVIRILALLVHQALEKGSELSAALAAPTGKAASRLKESIAEIKGSLSLPDKIKQNIPDEAVTLHQLLGARRHSIKYKYNKDNPLPYDVLIIDEASMIDQALMSKLMNAMLVNTKLILLGDKDQLSSVEAGAVLGNICGISHNVLSPEFSEILSGYNIQVPEENRQPSLSPLTDNIILLQKNFRFAEGGGIALLSDYIKKGLVEEAVSLFDQPSSKEISFREFEQGKDFSDILKTIADDYIEQMNNCSETADYFESYSKQGVLAAHRKGFLGIDFLNNQFEKIIKREKGISGYQEWYQGRPVIINQNSYSLGLFNGDIGICMLNDQKEWRIYFEKEGDMLTVAPSRLPDFDIAYALTIHKSQGSEFKEVNLVLPNESSRLLSRELLYTGITRARSKVQVFGSLKAFKQGVKREISRSSGLKSKLW